MQNCHTRQFDVHLICLRYRLRVTFSWHTLRNNIFQELLATVKI